MGQEYLSGQDTKLDRGQLTCAPVASALKVHSGTLVLVIYRNTIEEQGINIKKIMLTVSTIVFQMNLACMNLILVLNNVLKGMQACLSQKIITHKIWYVLTDHTGLYTRCKHYRTAYQHLETGLLFFL